MLAAAGRRKESPVKWSGNTRTAGNADCCTLLNAEWNCQPAQVRNYAL